ncbi:MAG: EexN family lipoprotein [Methylococcales bacterium]
MKKTDDLISMTHKVEPILTKISWPSTSLLTVVAAAIVFTVGVMAFQRTQEAKTPEVKSVAWYAANPKEARETNKACFDSQQLQATENCINSLHALEISYKGSNT